MCDKKKIKNKTKDLRHKRLNIMTSRLTRGIYNVSRKKF